MKKTTPINFMKLRLLYFFISLAVIIPGAISLVRYGLKPAIDFTGGTLLEIKFLENPDVNETVISETLTNFEIASIQTTGQFEYLLRLKPLSPQENLSLQTTLSERFGQLEEIRFETVGPTLGQELLNKTLVSISLAAMIILLYIAYRFKDVKYGVTAILAMLHDTFILIGVFSLLGHFWGIEVDTLFVTAVLTILSFSVHDTIVVYDRIRESVRRYPNIPFVDIVNKAVVETLSRSINNSMTIIFMLLALYLLGGETVKWFVFALLIGTIAGTYSSTFTAAPLLLVWEDFFKKKRKF